MAYNKAQPVLRPPSPMHARRMRKRALYPRAVAVRRSMAWPPYPRYPRRPLAPPHPAPVRKSHKLFSKRVFFVPCRIRTALQYFGVLRQYCAGETSSFLPTRERREQSKSLFFALTDSDSDSDSDSALLSFLFSPQ